MALRYRASLSSRPKSSYKASSALRILAILVAELCAQHRFPQRDLNRQSAQTLLQIATVDAANIAINRE
jgi:hypothetical protein